MIVLTILVFFKEIAEVQGELFLCGFIGLQ